MEDEEAKADQEIAKATGKGIDATREFGRFCARFVSPPLDEVSGIVTDGLKIARWEIQKVWMGRVIKYEADQGQKLPSKHLPLKLAVPLFQSATLEDDEYLQDMWARLLVNCTNEENGMDLRRHYIDILERISPFEAQILDKIYSLSYDPKLHEGILTGNLPNLATLNFGNNKDDELCEPSEEVTKALANLKRLDCISLPTTWGGGEIFTHVNPTVIGKSFVEACTNKSCK